MVSGSLHISLFKIKFTQLPMQVSCIERNWVTLNHYKMQTLLDCTDCRVETSQCQPDISQNSACADCIRDVSGCPQFHRVIGEDPVGCFQVPACPVSHPQEHGCLTVSERIRYGELEYPAGIPHRIRYIAECLSDIGAANSNCRR